MREKNESHRIVSIWTGRIIPLILIGVTAYATYVFVVRLCIHYLLIGQSRHGVAIAFLVVYFILFLLMSICYIRLLTLVNTDPGYVPLGQAAKADRASVAKRAGGPLTSEVMEVAHTRRSNEHNSTQSTDTDNTIINEKDHPDSPGLELFYTKDVFVCEQDGRPKWCSECGIWKHDRTHHCSDVGRCVKKMDHFCPWVGGVVGENSFKFFVQFVTYTWIYCFFLLVVVAIYFQEQKTSGDGSSDVQFAAILGLAGFFGLFTFGMSCSSTHFCLTNLTTIENINRRNKVWQLAVFFSNGSPGTAAPTARDSDGLTFYLPTITYPLSDHPLPQPQTSAANTISVQPPPSSQGEALTERDAQAQRTFAILRLEPGENPWDLGYINNWKDIMGNNAIDWLLPIKRSPCTNHDDPESRFKLGPAIQRLREKYIAKERFENRG